MFPRAQITGVSFGLAGSSDNKKGSYVNITSSALLTDGKPQPGGFYDTHMGPMGINLRCSVCDGTSKKCKGHMGSLTLNQPVWHPMGVSECRKWLKLICFDCGEPFVDIAKFTTLPAASRLDLAQKFARTKLKSPCVKCGKMHKVVKKGDKKVFAVKIFFENSKSEKETLLPHKIAEILSRVSDQVVISLGKPLSSHPRNLILFEIPVPSVVIRPDIKKYAGGGKSSVDKLTAGFQTLFRKNAKLPNILPDTIGEKLETAVIELSEVYFALIRTNVDEGASIAQRITGKKGHVRRNLLGKRVFVIGRDTIAGSSNVPIDEFAVPLRFAKVLQVAEIVTAYNLPRIMGYVINGRKAYPGATEVVKASGAKHSVESMIDNIEIGDVVYRDLIDGDLAEFNRQPSLRASNLQAHKVRIIRDPAVRVFLINPTAVKVYDGDFDGDEMNIIVSPSISSRVELKYLSTVPNWLVNFDNSVPVFGHIEDSIMGIADMTRSFTTLNKYAVNWLYKNCAICPSITNDVYTGREALSLVFDSTPINYTRASGYCADTFKDYIKYDPRDKVVSVVNGVIQSGIIDKKSTGSGSPNNIFHVIARDYTPRDAMRVMHDMQLIGIGMNQFRNTTLCVADLILPPEFRKMCEEINTSQFIKSYMITEKYKRGDIIPPIGKTVRQFYEELQIPALSPGDAFVDPVMRSVDCENNGYMKMIFAGSKGSFNNYYNMVTSVGPRLTNGKRPPMDFGYKRSLPYFKRFDTNPLSRGYVENPYIKGLTGPEIYWNAWAARVDLILKQLFTSVSGKQARISAVNLEAIFSNYFGWTVKASSVVDFMYGDDGMDPRRLTSVKFPTVMISSDAFAAYKHPDYPEFFEQMSADRSKYRRIFTQLEGFAEFDVMTDERKMPIDVAHIVTNVTNEMPSKTVPSPSELKIMVKMVTEYCADFAYLLINDIQKEARAPIPLHLQAVAWLPQMLIRSYLHPNALVSRHLTPITTKLILNNITKSYMMGLMAPGTAVGTIAATCFSAYLTQFIIDAHRRSAVGGTSKTGMTLMSEILSAKPTDKLSMPSMIVPVLPQFASSEAATKKIANTLEAMHFKRFVSACQIFLEKYGKPVHPKYAHEITDIATFDKLNPLLRAPVDLLNYCLRFSLITSELILKNISIETIIGRLRETFPATFMMYTPENSQVLYIRVYCRASMFKNAITEAHLVDLANQMLSCLVRGINGIKEANVIKLHKSRVNPDDSISRETEIYAIKTQGTNLIDVCCHEHVDAYHVTTESVQELASVFGIEVARHKIILGMKGIVEISHRHYTIYAGEMTWTGRVTNIEASGMRARAPTSVLMQAGLSGPVQVLENAAINGLKDEITGLTAPLMIGSIPKLGTNYGRLVVNSEFVRAHVKSADDIFEAAL